MGLPLSSVSKRASSSACASTRSPSFHNTRARSMGFILAHGPSSAARAARTARSTSSAPASATVVMGSSVAGFTVVNVAPLAASTASPLMMSRPGFTGASVSDISNLHRDGTPDACAFDLLGVMPVVFGETPHHVAERVPVLPHVVRLLRHLAQPHQQLFAQRVEPAHRFVPGVRAQRGQVGFVRPPSWRGPRCRPRCAAGRRACARILRAELCRAPTSAARSRTGSTCRARSAVWRCPRAGPESRP